MSGHDGRPSRGRGRVGRAGASAGSIRWVDRRPFVRVPDGPPTIPPAESTLKRKADGEPEEASSKVRRSSSLAPNFSGNIITVQVGDGRQKKSISIHEALLIKHSEYFRVMLGKEWKERNTHVVSMPEDDPASFELFAGFVYTGRVFSNAPSSAAGVRAKSKEQEHDAEEFERLAHAWALGEKLMSTTFKDAVTDATINKIYAAKPDRASPMRRHGDAPPVAPPLWVMSPPLFFHPAAGSPAAGPPAAGPLAAGPSAAGPSHFFNPAAGPPAAGPLPAGPPPAGPPPAGPPPAGPPAAGPPPAGPPAAGPPAAGPPAAGVLPLHPTASFADGSHPVAISAGYSAGPHHGNFPTNMHSIVWSQSATAQVGMKKLLVNIAVSSWDVEKIKEMKHDDGVPKEFLPDRTTITVKVGRHEKLFVVDEGKLKAHSDFFKAALKQEWNEEQERAVVLPDERDPETFEISSHFINSGANYTRYDGEDTDSESHEWRRLGRLWQLGDRILSTSVRDAATDSIIEEMDVESEIPVPLYQDIYRGGRQDSAARKLMVDVATREWNVEGFA
ncbi:hypothetical protein Tdes44962_MAKER03789 [Teratosphaeria destructans]|uniref:BTB domain-containing protein n=1 Tax=Teratosphaeria destructans TaxID=418781 RepID=A0A9W7SNT3_9PEZI|nr:hypothetical protein Tdes44962_MAKER03789 [Teratosphaeria destructans]